MVTYQQFMNKHKQLSKKTYVDKYKIIKVDKKRNLVWLEESDCCVLECSITEIITRVMNGTCDISNASKLKVYFEG